MDFQRSARRLRAAALLPMVAFGVVACGDSDDVEGPMEPVGPGSLAEVASDDPRLTTLVAALEAAGLDASLETAGPFTVFAPDNDAFAGLPDGWVDNLLLPENEDLLDRVLTYHVAGGAVLSSTLTDGQEITTLEGSVITVGIDGSTITLTDESDRVVGIVEADIEASNGVLHIVDDVFLPGLDVVETAQLAGYGTLVSLVETAELTETLQGEGPFTIFAPSNEALEAITAEGEDLSEVLTYHVVAGAALQAGDLTDGQVLTTVQGEELTIGVDAPQDAPLTVTVTDANGNSYEVEEADLVATNGVIHGIGGVLLPASTIPEVAAYYGLTGLIDAAVLAELDDDLSAGSWTVFAPTNDVFDALPVDGEDNPVVVNPLLADILTYHVIAGDPIFAADLSDGQVAEMANGDEIVVNIDGETVTLSDAFENEIAVTATDIQASNGVVHVISGLLTPSLNIAEVATLNGFTTLLDLVVEAGLDDELSDEEADLTVFAPTNEAFAALSEVPTGSALEQVLLYHVVDGSALSTDLTDGQEITTLQGGIVTVSIDGETVTLTDGQENTVTVTLADVPANNGVIHVIDGVLLPPTT